MYRDETLEKTVLAFLLNDNRFLSISDQVLRPEFFAYPQHIRIFKAIKFAYHKWHTTLDYDIFEQKFVKNAKMESDEETEYLVLFRKIQEIKFDETKFSYYVDELKDLKIKREMKSVAERIEKKLDKSEKTGEELISELAQDIHKIRVESDLVIVKKKFVYEDVRDRIKIYKERKGKGDIPGIPYGWQKLDEMTGGHFKQELIIVMARTGGGKTRVLHNFAYNANLAKQKVLYVTIEMSSDEICKLYDSRLCKLHYKKIKDGKLTEDEENRWKMILKTMEERERKGFYVVDIPQGCTVDTIEQEVYDYEKNFGKLDCVVVDYLALMESSEKGLSSVDKIGNIAKHLKQLARAKDISVITAAQANRESLKVEGTDVGTEHISLSDQIGHHANVVLYLFRTPEDKLKNTIKVNLVKYRDGGGLWFQLYSDWARNYIGDAVWQLDTEKEKKK